MGYPASLLTVISTSANNGANVGAPRNGGLINSFCAPTNILTSAGALTALPGSVFVRNLNRITGSNFVHSPRVLRVLRSRTTRLHTFSNSAFLNSPLRSIITRLVRHAMGIGTCRISSSLGRGNLHRFLGCKRAVNRTVRGLRRFH